MSILNEKITVGQITLNSRLVMPPMETGKSDHGAISRQLCNYYDEKSKGGRLGLVVTEHCYVSPEGKANRNQVSVSDDTCIEGLTLLANTIHQNRVPVILQISHAGSKTKTEITGLETISASPVVVGEREGQIPVYTIPKEMTRGDIERVRKCFLDAAVRAKRAGMDGVEIHAAHGYLLNQFYSPLTNKRTDKYRGDTLEGRTHLLVQIIQAVREFCGKSFLISVRLGACDYRLGGSSALELPKTAKMIETAGADMISISGGICAFTRPGHKEPGWFAELSERAKKAVSIPILLTGGIKERESAINLLRKEKCDLIGIGRALLQDSELPAKMLEERTDEI